MKTYKLPSKAAIASVVAYYRNLGLGVELVQDDHQFVVRPVSVARSEKTRLAA